MLNYYYEACIMDENKLKIIAIALCAFIAILSTASYAQKPYRAGTTTANFLEIGYGSAGNAMGDAYVSVVNDLSAIYWNPAGLGYIEQNEVLVMYQPWLVDINTSLVGAGLVHPLLGTFAAGLLYVGYGEEEVTTLISQEGTGEKFDGHDLSFTFSYGKRLVDWFSFGATAKYINCKIWHETAHAVACDLGVIVNTRFLSRTDKPGDGLNIGMSISNYGTKMTYSGIDLKQPVDILPEEEGNFKYVPARYELQGWELPLIFRLGVSFHPIVIANHRLTLAVDALHPNNNSESINIGGRYELTLPLFGVVSLRGGYKALFLNDSEYGLSLGAGLRLFYLGNNAMSLIMHTETLVF